MEIKKIHFFLGAVLCTQDATPVSLAIKNPFCDVKLSNEKNKNKIIVEGAGRALEVMQILI